MMNSTTVLTNEEEGGTSGQVAAIVDIVIIIGAVVASLLLILSAACQRILRTPFYMVMASWALSNLICSAILALEVVVLQQGSWPFPGIVCKYYEYVTKAVSLIRFYHMPLAAIVACFSRKFPVWFKSWPWANVVIPIVICLYVWVGFLILATPYIGSTAMFHYQDISICSYRNENTALAVNSLVLYWFPSLLSLVMLLVWACVFVRRSRAVPLYMYRRENSEGMILFVVIHVFIVSRLALIVVTYLQTSGVFHWSSNVLYLVYGITRIVANSDYFLAPFICLFFVGIYRDIFCLPCRGQADMSEKLPEPAAVPLTFGDDVSIVSEADWAFTGL